MSDWDDMRIFLETARCRRLVDAARRLGLDHSTVSRRIRRFEERLSTQLFERDAQGYTLSVAGAQLLERAEQMEQFVNQALEEAAGQNRQLYGNVRLGTTEGFGHFVIAPQLAHFCLRYPAINVDLMPLPRIVNLNRNEADLAISVERPEHASLVVAKLCDYRLRLYASRDYLQQHPPIRKRRDLARHTLISYVEDLLFTDELNYMRSIIPGSLPSFRSTSVISQYTAACEGLGVAILPCFLAARNDSLVPLLENDIDLVRSFWLTAPADRRRLARITVLWDYLKQSMDDNRAFLMGESRQMQMPPPVAAEAGEAGVTGSRGAA